MVSYYAIHSTYDNVNYNGTSVLFWDTNLLPLGWKSHGNFISLLYYSLLFDLLFLSHLFLS